MTDDLKKLILNDNMAHQIYNAEMERGKSEAEVIEGMLIFFLNMRKEEMDQKMRDVMARLGCYK